jgi:hypothetical protein
MYLTINFMATFQKSSKSSDRFEYFKLGPDLVNIVLLILAMFKPISDLLDLIDRLVPFLFAVFLAHQFPHLLN